MTNNYQGHAFVAALFVTVVVIGTLLQEARRGENSEVTIIVAIGALSAVALGYWVAGKLVKRRESRKE